MNSTKYIIVIMFMLAFSVGAFARVQVFAQVDSSEDIYAGENFTYHIIIDGENRPGLVNTKPLAQYHPQHLRNSDASERSIVITNGRRTENVTKRYVSSYSLSAAKPGKIQLPPVEVAIDGKTYTTNPVEVNILEPGTTDNMDIEVTLSDQRCYLGQPIIITINFYVSDSIRIDNFNFSIPAFDGDDFHIEDPDITGLNLKEFRLRTGLSVFVSRHNVTHKGENFILLTFNKILIPKSLGQIQIEPTTVFADIAVSRVRQNNRNFFGGLMGPKYKYQRFTAESKSQTLTVLPLPKKAQPKEFYGLMGRYTITASAIPTKVSIGDPITLTIKIGGSRYLKPIQWPALEQVTKLAENFRIPPQKAMPVIDNGFKVFTQTIRANNDKVTEIPPIPVAFFDPDKAEFVVARTEPIKLDVAPTKILTSRDMEGMDATPISKEVEAIKKGLSANYEGLDVLKNTSFSPLAAAIGSGYTVVWALPLAGLVLSSLIKLFTHTNAEKTAARRRRRAGGKAAGLLKKVISAKPQTRGDQLILIMKQFIGERFDKIAGSLTADDCREIISTAAQDTQTADKYRDIIVKFEEARYAAIQTEANSELIKEVIELIGIIEKKSKK